MSAHDPIVPTRTRGEIAADNRAELESWIDERAAELVANGVSADDARRRALAEFGDAQGATHSAQRDDIAADRRVRALLWLEEFASDMRIAARTLARTPSVTAVVLLTFALGIGATTAVFSVVHAMLIRPLPYGDEASLVYMPATDNRVIRPGLGGARHSAAGFVVMAERTTSFSGVAAVLTGTTVLTDQGDAEQLFGSGMSPNAFEVLQARAAIGRVFGAAEIADPTRAVVILLDGLWRRKFGADSGIVGRTIAMRGIPHEVIGVMPRGFRVPTYEGAEYITPWNNAGPLRNVNAAQVRVMRLFGRAKPGVAMAAVQTDVNRAMHAMQAAYPATHGAVEARVVSIRTAVAGEARPRLIVLMGAAAFVLLIACANVAGILLSRALARRHELSVRIALGAGRRRLMRQFMAEGAVLAVAGAAIGLVVAQMGIGALRAIASDAFPAGTTFGLEPSVVVFAIGVAMIAAIASSLVPALGATRAPAVALRQSDARVAYAGGQRMRLGLVAGQLAVSVVLLIGAGLFLRTLHRLSTLDLGYPTERGVTFRLPFVTPKPEAEQDVFYATLYESLRATPGVASVGGGNLALTGSGTVAPFEVEGRTFETGRLPDARNSPASDDYFSTLGIPTLRGRTFGPSDHAGVPWVAVISEQLAKQVWPDGDPIGARVKTNPNNPWATIVGVVGDVRTGAADAPIPSIYTSQRQDHWPGGTTVVLRASRDAELVFPAIRETVKRVAPGLPVVDLRTFEEYRNRSASIAERRLQMQLMIVFAIVALVVSAIGVYGVTAYATEARRREFGIRMALGASRRGVLWLALRDGVRIAAFGAILGVPLALLLAGRMREMLFSVAPFDPLIVSVVVGGLMSVVLAASLVPARRATLIDPARTMRAE